MVNNFGRLIRYLIDVKNFIPKCQQQRCEKMGMQLQEHQKISRREEIILPAAYFLMFWCFDILVF